MGYLMWLTLFLYVKYSQTLEDDYDDYPSSGDDHQIERYWQDDDIIILQTLDGKIHAVDKRSGGLLWDTQLNSQWFPQAQDESCNTSGDGVDYNFLPDPSDGSIYAYDKGQLSKLPMTIPQMVEISPSRSNDDDILYIGEKKDNWYILDKQTGKIKRRISNQKRDEPSESVLGFAFDDIYIGYTDYTLTMYDAKSNNLKWNFTYSELKATESVSDLDPKHLDIEVSASSGDIWILGNDDDGKVKSSSKKRFNLGFPVIGVFSSSKSGLRRHQFKTFPADHFTGRQTDNSIQLVYVGLHRNSLYAVQSYSDSNKKIAPGCDTADCPQAGYDIIGWHEIIPTISLDGKRPGLPPSDDTMAGTIIPSPRHCKIGDNECPTHRTADLKSDKDIESQVKLTTIQKHFKREAARERYRQRKEQRRKHRKRPEGATLSASETILKVEALVNIFTNVKILQSIIVIMIVLFIIFHSWKNIFEEDLKKTKVGQIEFDQEELLGKGCLGTSVFRGSFDGRDVAVKRMLADSFALAEREIRLLRQAEHPNLLRYYCSEKDKMFIYIALELCHCDLDSFVTQRENFELTDLEIMLQCATGLEHIHSLGVIHRDIKPSNILITFPRRSHKPRAVIADFGLSRQMEIGKSSISVTGLYGTEGWAAPEVFSRDSRSVTCAVDIFSLGCVYYFCLSGGKHPYGSEFFMRQARIHQGRFELENIDPILFELISRMIQPKPADRITIAGVLKHPVFWEKDKILRFLSETSDRLEREELDSKILYYIEQFKEEIGGHDWKIRLAENLQKDLRKFRTYGECIRDLLRAIRNKRHHHRDLTPEAQLELGVGPDSFWDYFDARFPMLLATIYKLISILYAEENDVNFDKFYDFKSAEITSRLVKLELETMELSNEKAKDSVAQNFNTGSVSFSPKVQKASKLEDDLPYSHKIKTKMIWTTKDNSKHKYNKQLDRLEPSICRLFDGTEISIAKDIPVRDEPIPFDFVKNVEFPRILAILEDMKLENERNRAARKSESTKIAREESLSRREEELLYRLDDNALTDTSHPPRFVQGLPLYPPQNPSVLRVVSNGVSNSFQRVTNAIQRQFSETGSVGREMCEHLLKEELDADAETIQFSRDPTPPPFIIPDPIQIEETSFKSTTKSAEISSKFAQKNSTLLEQPNDDENKKPDNVQSKKPCRRKRNKGNNSKKKST